MVLLVMKSSAANGWGGVGGKEQYKIELLPELVLKSSTGVWISQTHVPAGGELLKEAPSIFAILTALLKYYAK